MKKILAVFLAFLLISQSIPLTAESAYILQEEMDDQATKENAGQNTTEGVEISAPSGVLMEAATGQVLYEKDANTKMPPASVTKVMTMLLIFDALEEGKIKLEDKVTVSDYAAGMGGSQVFLEPGETQSVDTMLKCIAVASANDACVAMAEHISGSEEAFVKQMNERAKGLGMKNTNFVNCNGLDADGHETTALDIALMSRELITKYPQVHEYCTIWMDTITHTTKKGTSEFGLTNTNKFIRQYQYATGLKTGSTSKAKFCLSATAKKDDLELVGVVMAAENAKERVKDAIALMNYGFSKCNKFEDNENLPQSVKVPVTGGIKDEVTGVSEGGFQYVDTSGADLSKIEKKIDLKKEVKAPVTKGEELGKIIYSLDGKTIGEVQIQAAETVEEASFPDMLKKAAEEFLL